MATPKLRNPPIVEAVCELRWTGGSSYSLVPGTMRELIREKFPEIEILPSAMLPIGITIEGLPPIPHHRFKSRTPNALVQTGPGLLSVNVLPSYPGFEVFRDLILYVVEKYRKAIGSDGLSRIGLRYVNHMQATEQKIEIANFFKIAVQYPLTLPHPPREVSSRVVLTATTEGTLALAVALPAQVGQGPYGALLDLDLFWEPPKDYNLDDFPRWLDEAHSTIYQAFMSTIADDLLDKMRGG